MLIMELDAWSPQGFRFASMAVGISIIGVEWVRSIVDLFGDPVHFIAYNSIGFLLLCGSLWFGRKTVHHKTMWFLNGTLIASLFLLWYGSQFTIDEHILPAIYSLEITAFICLCNKLRTYENPQQMVELAQPI